MATGAANMRALSRQVESIPDDAVAELVRWFVPRSEQVGKRMIWYGHDVQLSSRLRKRSRRKTDSRVVLAGTPAGAWSVLSYGRRGDYDIVPRRKLALSISDVIAVDRVHITKAVTKGDGRWDKLVREADAKFPDVVARLVDKRVTF